MVRRPSPSRKISGNKLIFHCSHFCSMTSITGAALAAGFEERKILIADAGFDWGALREAGQKAVSAIDGRPLVVDRDVFTTDFGRKHTIKKKRTARRE